MFATAGTAPLIEDNDRRDAGVSPTRQRVQATYYYELGDRWKIETNGAYRASDYDDTAPLREEKLSSIAVGASFDINDDWALSLRYRFSENDSSDPVYSYERNQVTIGVRYLIGP
jgi:uncharacterized protein (PEP-CTERM system associated)